MALVEQVHLVRRITQNDPLFVYEAMLGDERVLVKLIRAVKDAPEARRYEHMHARETQHLRKLAGHEAIVRLIDSGYAPDAKSFAHDEGISGLDSWGWYLVQEFVEGATLKDALLPAGALGKVGLSKRVRLLSRIADALAYIHEQHLTHRDVKPENVMVFEDGLEWRCKIIDFGISRDEENPTGDVTFFHAKTRKYASPEQWRNEPPSFTTDIFSFGLVATALLSPGYQVRAKHESRQELDEEIAGFIKTGLPKGITDLVAKCLAFDPDDRFQTFNEIAALLDVIAESLEMPAVALVVQDKLWVAVRKTEDEFYREIDKDLGAGLLLALKPGGNAINAYGAHYDYELSPDPKMPDRVFRMTHAYAMNRKGFAKLNAARMPANWRRYRRLVDVPLTSDIRPLISKLRISAQGKVHRRAASMALKQRVDAWRDVIRIQKELKLGAQKNYESAYSLAGDVEDLVTFKVEEGKLFSVESTIAVRGSGSARFLRVGTIVEAGSGLVRVQRYDGQRMEIPKTGVLRVDISSDLLPLTRADSSLARLGTGDVGKTLRKMFSEPEALGGAPNDQISFEGDKLREGQRAAVRSVLGSVDVTLVHGPPGTGKTHLITTLIRKMLAAEPTARILIASQSNVALDNALQRVVKLVPGTSVVRHGQLGRVADEIKALGLRVQIERWRQSIEERLRRKIAADAANPEVAQLADSLTEMYHTDYSRTDKTRVETDLKAAEELLVDAQELIANLKVPRPVVSTVLGELESSDATLPVALGSTTELAAAFPAARALPEEQLEALLGLVLITSEVRALRVRRDGLIGRVGEGVKPDPAKAVQRISTLSQEQQQKIRLAACRKEWLSAVQDRAALIERDFVQYAATVVGATCHGSGDTRKLGGPDYDLVIVDEAARATPGELLTPLLNGEKYLIIGDHQQLPPHLEYEAEGKIKAKLKSKRLSDARIEELVDRSLFQSLFGAIPDASRHMLDEQFRMKPVLGSMVSSVFYDGKLKNGQPEDAGDSLYWKDSRLVWVDTSAHPAKTDRPGSFGFGWQNELEAKAVAAVVSAVAAQRSGGSPFSIGARIGQQAGGVSPIAIAILTGYTAQRKLIEDHLARVLPKCAEAQISIQVSTVDNFQGREADIAIYSAVRSNKEFRIGFLEDVRRLNVALSRAQHQLIIIGDAERLRMAKMEKDSANRFSWIQDFIDAGASKVGLAERTVRLPVSAVL